MIPPDVIESSDLSAELRTLLNDKLDSLEKLEIVLALRAAERPLPTADLAKQLQVGHDALLPVVDDVVDSGIAEVKEHGLVLRSGSWDPLIEEAAAVYTNDPTKLMKALTRIAMQRIRGMAARTFADAFRIRKKGG